MFNLGFTMEELMFPENSQSNFLFNSESDYSIDKLDELSSTYNYQEQVIIDDDDWFTIKQLNPDISLNDSNISLINDQTLPSLNGFSNNYYFGQVKSVVELDGTITTLLLPNLPNKVACDKNNLSSTSDTVPTHYSSISCDEQLLTATDTIAQQQQSNKHMMSKSTSSLSFCTQSSTSMTSILKKKMCSRRRKRTIFSIADIEHLKEAFIQNPKPSQQDISILSEQLGHDSYVIRVWFYNKRQATKNELYKIIFNVNGFY